MLVIGCERSRKAEISGEAARGIEKSVPELAAVVLSNPSFSMSPDHEVARVDGSPLLSSDLRVFIDRARANGYRPASLSEARRLLRAALQEKALALDAERRGHSPSDPVGLEATYQELTVELTGSVPLGGSDDGGSRDFRAEDQQIERIHAQHRGRIQRVAILEALLDRSRVEVDLAQLARFVDEPGPSGSPPRPPITAARDDETSS